MGGGPAGGLRRGGAPQTAEWVDGRRPRSRDRPGVTSGTRMDGSRPRVSVLIAARDAAATLAATLDSLSRQTAPPDEIVVVDDGSTDKTADIAGATGAHVVRTPPLGLAVARN